MDFLTDNILSYETFKNALDKIEEKLKWVKSSSVGYFFRDDKKDNDKYLSIYVNSVTDLRKAMGEFNNLFEDFMMEIEQAEFEAWEIEQENIEGEYYNEGRELFN